MAEIEEVTTEVTTEVNQEANANSGKGRKNFSGRAKGEKRDNREKRDRDAGEFDKRVVCVRRVQKVVKGGRTLRFSALVVVGDGKGKVGLGIGKS